MNKRNVLQESRAHVSNSIIRRRPVFRISIEPDELSMGLSRVTDPRIQDLPVYLNFHRFFRRNFSLRPRRETCPRLPFLLSHSSLAPLPGRKRRGEKRADIWPESKRNLIAKNCDRSRLDPRKNRRNRVKSFSLSGA